MRSLLAMSLGLKNRGGSRGRQTGHATNVKTRHSSTMRCPLSVVSEQNFVKTVACCMKCLGQKLPQ